jgi:uncharacterized protein YbjT (DUF2867 family)
VWFTASTLIKRLMEKGYVVKTTVRNADTSHRGPLLFDREEATAET